MNNIFYVRVKYGHIFFGLKKIQQENKPLIKILTEIIHLKTVKYVYIKERKQIIYIYSYNGNEVLFLKFNFYKKIISFIT